MTEVDNETTRSAAAAPLPQAPESAGHSIRYWLGILLKRKLLIFAALVVVLGGVTAWTYSLTPIYRAAATVIVERRAPQVLGKDVREVVDLSRGNYWNSKEYMRTQVNMITSKSLAEKVARKKGLKDDEGFWSNVKGEAAARKSGSRKRSVKAAANRLQGMVSAEPIKESNILALSIEHPDPEVAARLANAVAQAYIDQNVEYRLSSTNDAVKWLANQVDEMKKELAKAEMALHDFKKANNIISVSLEDRRSLIVRQIEKYNDALTELRMKRIAIKAERDEIKNAQEKDPLEMSVEPVMGDATIKGLRMKYREAYRAYAGLRETYLDKHPKVRRARALMETIKSDLDRAVKLALNSHSSRFRKYRKTEASLAAALQQAKEEALALNKKEVQYRRLKRNQENTAKLYAKVLMRLKESDLTARLRVNNIRLLDRAVEPKKPVHPRVKLNLLVGALLGLMLGIGLAFLIETMDTSIKSQEDVELVPGLTYLGFVPRVEGSGGGARSGRRREAQPDTDLIVHRNPKSQVAESSRSIRTNLLFAASGASVGRLLVTSPAPREGKTTSAINLAIAMAQAGTRVLLVDTDMRRPRVHKIFEVPGNQGITSVLVGEAQIDDVIKTTEVPGLSVLPCGPTPPNPAELCQNESFRELLDQLEQRFDRLILDSPPVMVVTDAVVLSTMVEGVLMIARTNQVQDVGGRLLGCVLNDMDLEHRGYGYRRYRPYSRYGPYRYGYGQYGSKEEEAPS